MGAWEKFNEAWLPEKEDFCSYLNMESITDPDDTHGKRVGNHDLYIPVMHHC